MSARRGCGPSSSRNDWRSARDGWTLTNYFDRNAFANDETSQFISDALVNNPTLGLAVNGIGVAGVFDPKNGLLLKAGFQQSSNEATNLSEALYTLVEADYVARPRGLSEGTYRVWLRNDNSTGTNRAAGGISADQKLSQLFGLFGRYGTAANMEGHDHFYSFGFQVQNGLVFNPLDYWGAGYAQSDLGNGDHEKIVEGYSQLQDFGEAADFRPFAACVRIPGGHVVVRVSGAGHPGSGKILVSRYGERSGVRHEAEQAAAGNGRIGGGDHRGALRCFRCVRLMSRSPIRRRSS